MTVAHEAVILVPPAENVPAVPNVVRPRVCTVLAFCHTVATLLHVAAQFDTTSLAVVAVLVPEGVKAQLTPST